MSDQQFTILSTASIPFERLPDIPGNINVRVIPFTEILACDNKSIESYVVELAAQNIAVVFTSAHAVKFVAELLPGKVSWKVYCIRNETRNAVIKFLGSEVIENFASNALDLSRRMLEDGVREAVFFCGDQRMDILPDQLIRNGVNLKQVIVYKTLLTPVALDEVPDAILFFSPTAVRSFFSVNALSPRTRVFAMGRTTAGELEKNTSAPIIISPEADKAFVFTMAAEYAASKSIT